MFKKLQEGLDKLLTPPERQTHNESSGVKPDDWHLPVARVIVAVFSLAITSVVRGVRIVARRLWRQKH